MTALKATVLISGNGSNLQALIDARNNGRLEIDIVHVISNRADAKGLQRAGDAGIRFTVLEHQGYADRDAFDHALALIISATEPEWVILAGFMRIIGNNVLDHFAGRMINLHPSLLPLYRGTDTYQRALDAGDREHGASIHFVTAELDGGPVISQLRIPILAGDDQASLTARLAPMEHQLMVSTMEFLSRHEVRYHNAAVFVDGNQLAQPLQLQADDTLC